MVSKSGNVEGAGARLQVERDEPYQRDERAQAQVHRNLERGVVLLLAAAPDANHDKCGHQGQFVEEVEEEEVERSESAQDAARHNQQQYVEIVRRSLTE